MVKEVSVSTSKQVHFVNITDEVKKVVKESGVKEGHCHVYVPHTTAGVTINEGADPHVVSDIIMVMNRTVPFVDNDYLHREGNSAAHIKASLMGSSASVFVQDGKLLLGTWQAIFFCEFDGPRSRRLLVQVS
ncbi:YjbQ family protein [candidate division KSB1 bacterium]|nr:YjbQ family protein [candidate division KSB1 bacterium]NIR71335.1 YjbQ family protein [candidate division KSB1 bacterium]NIS26225.1 YjbQ family protein [candidate division KSB1 bacterium]NIT74655.1 YjbQ family protein [candidate division KSB1 bacterium]NIU26873.1 YjbQ family protein [candidate division KSB1 bacterium]